MARIKVYEELLTFRQLQIVNDPNRHKIITLTGGDCVGKATQSALLTHVLQPATRMSFPEYGQHWAAEMVRAALTEQAVKVQRYDLHATEQPRLGSYAGALGAAAEPVFFKPVKHPIIFQQWQSADRLDRQAKIIEGLKDHHWIMDRYEVDALAFGLVDGCPQEWLDTNARLFVPSDLAIVLLGQGFSRPGEVKDLNERDDSFQARVQTAYKQVIERYDEQFTSIDVTYFRTTQDPLLSIWGVHQEIVKTINQRLGMSLPPLSYEEIYKLAGLGGLNADGSPISAKLPTYADLNP